MLKSSNIADIYDKLIDYIQDHNKTHNLSIKIYNTLNKLKSDVKIIKIEVYNDATFSLIYSYKNNYWKISKKVMFKDFNFKNI